MKSKLLGFNKCIKHLEKISQQTTEMAEQIIMLLANKGYQTAETKFRLAKYDGNNDVVVYWEKENRLLIHLVAWGTAVLYIEFGAGIHYKGEIHPQRDTISPSIDPLGSTPKSASGKHWAYKSGSRPQNPTDEYVDGSLGLTEYRYNKTTGMIVERTRPRPNIHLTLGNPPARAMYEADIEMRNEISNIVRSVINKYA